MVMVLTMVVVVTVMTLVLMVIRASGLGWAKTDGFVKEDHDHSAGMVVVKA